MPVYNGERFLREAVESILNQSYHDFEFIIVDDGSKDNSVAIIQEYKDDRIIILQNPKNMGITPTLNRGITQASGKYICRMDADDISLPNRLESQVNYLEKHPTIAIVGSNTTIINELGIRGKTEYYPQSNNEIKRSIFIHNPFAHSSVLIRRSVLDQLGVYDSKYLHNEDYDLWLRISAHYSIENLPEILLLRRVHGANITVNKELELIRFRIKTIYNAIVSYYKKPYYIIYLIRPITSYFYHYLLSVTKSSR